MGKFGDGKQKENEVYIDKQTRDLIHQVQDPAMLREIEK